MYHILPSRREKEQERWRQGGQSSAGPRWQSQSDVRQGYLPCGHLHAYGCRGSRDKVQSPRDRRDEAVAISTGQGKGVATSPLKEGDHEEKKVLGGLVICS